MPELYRSAYQFIEYHPEYSLIKRVIMDHPENMGRPGFQHEWLEYANTIRKFQPENILVDASRFDYIIPKEVQEWINQHVVSVFNEIHLKKWAIIIPPQFLNQVSIEQTIEANPANTFEVQYFESEEEARQWLHDSYWEPHTP
ncbi:MAG: hypothetical protein WCF67_06020 [Chitinophagaceae bacterium]